MNATEARKLIEALRDGLKSQCESTLNLIEALDFALAVVGPGLLSVQEVKSLERKSGNLAEEEK